MSRVLIFGADGLLGSHLYLALKDRHRLSVTLHGPEAAYPQRLFSGAETIFEVDAGQHSRIAEVFATVQPDWVLNAVGLVKRPLADDRVASLVANTIFPHRLAKLCATTGARLLHYSTDCVFSGKTGFYAESDPPDNTDWHGRCKILGEPGGPGVLVLRTSFIGLELGCKKSLLEWFLAQRGHVAGYQHAIWSGLSAHEVGRLTDHLIGRTDPIDGLWHVATPPISKYELLHKLNARLEERGGARGVTVTPDAHFICNRSLNGSAFAARSGYVPPSWDTMLDELVEDIARRWQVDAPSCWPLA